MVEDEWTTKKTGGVYYTPAHVVDYVVSQTVGKLLEGTTPDTFAPRGTRPTPTQPARILTVLDPSCGEGAFLLGAYRFLLDWYRRGYVALGPDQEDGRVRPRGDGRWELTLIERERILRDHLYGVDLDPQAVEATRRSLFAESLRVGNRPDHQAESRWTDARPALHLDRNIQCGNALVGPDYCAGEPSPARAAHDPQNINPFDWQTQFEPIMRRGGFDAVIGNPPYVDSEWMTSYLKSTRDYCNRTYQAATGNWDLFCVFAEKAVQLCRPGGWTSFVVPNKLGSAEYARAARRILALENTLVSLRDYSRVPVFPVAVYPYVYLVHRRPPQLESAVVRFEKMGAHDDREPIVENVRDLPYRDCCAIPSQPWRFFSSPGVADLLDKLQQLPRLAERLQVFGGATVAEAYRIRELIRDVQEPVGQQLRLVNSGTIDRYRCLWGVKKCRYLGSSFLRPVIPAELETDLPEKRRQQARGPKIIVAGMTKRLECLMDPEGILLAGKSTTVVCGEPDLRVVLGILNSRLVSFYYSVLFGGNRLQGGYLRIGPPQLKTIPLPLSHQSAEPTENAIRETVKVLQSLNEDFGTAASGDERAAVQQRIDTMDRRLDRLVYRLYELTDEEVRLVENSSCG